MFVKTHYLSIFQRSISNSFFSSLQKNPNFAAVFPGQGTQKVGMCREFLDYDWSKNFLDQCDEKLQFSITKLMTEGPKENLDLTEYAQPAIFIQSYLKYERAIRNSLIDENLIKYLFGHSLGEYNALVAAKSLDALDVIPLLRIRGSLMQKCCEGKEAAMFAVLTDVNKVSSVIESNKALFPNLVCNIAAINSPKQFIISGDLELLSQIKKEVRKERVAAARVNVSAAFHSSFLSAMKEEFRGALMKLDVRTPQKKVIRNYDANVYNNEDDIIEGLIEQIDHTVLFKKTVEYCFSKEINKFIDVGEEGMVATMLRQNSKEIEVLQLQ